METPPCSSAHRLGKVAGGASLLPPPEVCDRQGGFSRMVEHPSCLDTIEVPWVGRILNRTRVVRPST
jgi:hypothetical protein